MDTNEEVITAPDTTDPLWKEMQEEEVEREHLEKTSFDSGHGSSLLSTPGAVSVNKGEITKKSELFSDLDISRESGEISDEETGASVCMVQDEYNGVAYYVARSLAERLVLDNPPAPNPTQLSPLPVSRATLITDRVGSGLTKADRVIKMQNNVAPDFWELARMVGRAQVDVRYKFVLVQVGIDWCLTVKKNMIKEGMKRMLYAISKVTQGWTAVGIVGITPNLADYANTKVKTVTYNRCLKQAVRECQDQYRVEFLPWHLHFLQADQSLIQPLSNQ